ncbi:hypothetical protein IQ259_12080 [Fortiea sp. LEGE XX443]|uniref:hypothetical protein n=1 Tax=Fortiea sp. LEGE XX443 TaxID=1828611 RepID=UPI001881135A|nr:hypothetical protein [Fortiea sp. LEGE XX443]MBE9005765.1 hypothetical protein [Fortiea sp. LEGE XX443]
MLGVAESWDDLAQIGTNYQWFQPQIHPALMQRRENILALMPGDVFIRNDEKAILLIDP